MHMIIEQYVRVYIYKNIYLCVIYIYIYIYISINVGTCVHMYICIYI